MKHMSSALLLALAKQTATAPMPNISEYSTADLALVLRRLDALFHKLGEHCDAVEAETGTPCWKSSEYSCEIADRALSIEMELRARR